MLTTYIPEYNDLSFRQLMLSDEETMSYNKAWGGTIPWPREEWADWYDWWITNNEGKRYYRLLKDKTGRFVGEIAYHIDRDTGYALANVIIYAPFRRKGFGGEALDLLIRAAKENGISVLYDDIAIDNTAKEMFLKHGFIEEYSTEDKIFIKKEL